jgi:copper chaperone CopZ
MTNQATQNPITVTLAVEGMNCQSCVRHIDEALKENFKLINQAIDLDADRVTVTFDAQATSAEAIAKVLDEAGYPARAL